MINIPHDAIYKKSGWTRIPYTASVRDDFGVEGPALLLLTWPAPFLQVDVRSTGQGSSGSVSRYREMMSQLQIDEQSLDHRILTDRLPFCLLNVEEADELVFSLRVNTDDRNIAKHRDAPLSIPIRLTIYNRNVGSADPTFKQEQNLSLNIKKLLDLPQDIRGCVAVDLGTTHSCVAFLSDDFISAEQVDIVNCANDVEDASYRGVAPGPESIPTLLRIRQIKQTARKQLVSPGAYHGYRVYEDEQGHLVFGIKRLLTDPMFNQPMQVQLGGDLVDLDKSLPAEWFLNKTIKSFHAEKKRRLRPVAITFPSTYTRREIERTKKAVFRGYVRSLLNPSPKPELEATSTQQVVPLEIDEASAAAFYFIYRDFITGPGNTRGFHYCYPDGVTLLLYDCGGGTTDVSLVRATPSWKDSQSGVPNEKTMEIKVEVLGTSGHRSFGGDDITAAFYRVLKGMIAARYPTAFEPPLADMPSDPRRFVEWLERHYSSFHEILPTQTTVETLKELTAGGRRRRIQGRNAFWGYVEKLKIYVSDRSSDGFNAVDTRLDAVARLMTTDSRYLSDRSEQDVRDVIEDVVINDFLKLSEDGEFVGVRYVNELIRQDVEKTVIAANNLLSKKLKHGRDGFQMVDWVYLVGRSAHYRLIWETVCKKLTMLPWLEENQEHDTQQPADRLVTFCREVGVTKEGDDPVKAPSRVSLDSKNLKSAVVRGAVLALGCKLGLSDVSVKLDEHVARRLPFDVCWNSIATGPSALYTEGSIYEQLKETEVNVAEIQAPSSADNGMPTEQRAEAFPLHLYRIWPGDKVNPTAANEIAHWEKYLTFNFESRPQGVVKIYFDDQSDIQHESGFYAYDALNPSVKVPGIEFASLNGLGPLEKGEL